MTLPIGSPVAANGMAPSREDASASRVEDAGAGFAVALLALVPGLGRPEIVVPREGAAGSPAREGVGDGSNPSPAFAGVPAAFDPPAAGPNARPLVPGVPFDARPGREPLLPEPVALDRFEAGGTPRVTPMPLAPARPDPVPAPAAPVVVAPVALPVPQVPSRDGSPTEGPRRALEGVEVLRAPLAPTRESGADGEKGDGERRRGPSALLRASRRTARLPSVEMPGAPSREAVLAGSGADSRFAGTTGRDAAPAVAGVSSPGLDAWEARLSGARPPGDSVALRFENADGATGTLRLRLAGETLHARVVTADPALAGRLERDLDVLQQSLRERGFAAAHVEVRTPSAGESPRGSTDPRRDSERAPRQHERGSGGDGEARRGSRDRQPESR